VPKQLNNGKITEALAAAFGFKGRYIPMLDEVIVPVYQISDPAPSAPSVICAGTIIMPAPSTLPSAVTQVQIFNPAGSGVLCIISSASIGTLIDVGGPSTPVVRVGASLGASDLSELVGGSKGVTALRDRRLPGADLLGTPKCTMNGRLRTAIPESFIFFGALVKTDEASAELITVSNSPGRQPPYVLSPGTSFNASTQEIRGGGSLDDVEVLFNCAWQEIPLSGTTTPP